VCRPDFCGCGGVVVIYIPLLNEGTPCWRPVEGEQVDGNNYRILTAKPADEHWPVATGDVVRCEPHRFSDDHDCLVAILPGSGPIPPFSS
jgi:hypothetical protein